MSKFDADSYSQFRIKYPLKLFQSIRPLLSQSLFEPEPLRILDLGAGTGLSSESFLEFFPESQFVLVEPDQKMLQVASSSDAPFRYRPEHLVSKAEDFEVRAPFDGVLIGSAWHWMNHPLAISRIEKHLKPGAFVFVFEYQFPKAVGAGSLELNEWIRREFNLRWRVLDQKPRGTLEELTEVFRASGTFNERARVEFEETQNYSFQDWCGFIFSQSRYLDYEKRMSDEEKVQERARVSEALESFLPRLEQNEVSYWFQGFLFQSRRV